MQASYSENRHAENKTSGRVLSYHQHKHNLWHREPLEEKNEPTAIIAISWLVFDDHSHHNSHTNGVDLANQCRAALFCSLVCGGAGGAGPHTSSPVPPVIDERAYSISASPGGRNQTTIQIVCKVTSMLSCLLKRILWSCS